jgi:acyl-coenzyme A synthetase/AMP-(fatty) acid ligase
MMKLLEKLGDIWSGTNYPFLIHGNQELRFSQIVSQNPVDLSGIKQGDVVAIVGDFNPSSISTLLRLIDLGTIVVPLTKDTTHQHEYFFDAALVDAVIVDAMVTRLVHQRTHELIDNLTAKKHAGLVSFTSGTTGRPKAILHDLTLFLRRFEWPRPTLRTLNFLLFDHVGGLNTLFHTLFNKGVVIAPETRTVNSVLEVCRKHDVEVLPTTPTFLRLMLMNGAVPSEVPLCLKVITYGTERMDQPTLDELCRLLPQIDFRQTYGTSELGVLRVKSESRRSLFMKIGGEGVETRVVNNVLQIRSQARMLGYLNAPSPFDSEGWYDTKDVVEEKNGFYKIVGRTSDIINVAGLKFMASEVERVALEFPNVSLVTAYAKRNPITGEHVELKVQPIKENVIDKEALMIYLKSKLQPHMVPKRLIIEDVNIGHRFKKES